MAQKLDTNAQRLEGDCTEESDEELALRAARDAEVFGVLMRRYEGKLLTYIKRKSNVTHEGAEDLLQESFLKAYQNINGFDARLSFSSWMYRIVYNTTVSGWRKSSVRPEGHDANVDEEFMDKLQADGDIALEIDREFLELHVTDILATMDVKYRNALVLRFMEDKSYEEISDIIKKPMGTVATYISRAKKQFKKEYDRQSQITEDKKNTSL